VRIDHGKVYEILTEEEFTKAGKADYVDDR
jgi:hypothetical protein